MQPAILVSTLAWILGLALPPGMVPGPTPTVTSVSDLLEAAAEALGGQAAVARVRSVTAIADGRSPGGTYRMEVRSTRDGCVEFRHESTGRDLEVIVLVGSRAWARNERTGQIEPVDAGTAGAVRAHDFSMIAVDFGSRYSALELAGVVPFGGEECYRVRGRDAAGNDLESYFSAASHLLKGQSVRDASRPGAPAVRISFDEWRRVDGVLLPSRVTATDQKGDFVLSFTTLGVNDVDETIFTLADPARPAATPRRVSAGPSTRPNAVPR